MGNITKKLADRRRQKCRELFDAGFTYREIAEKVGLKSTASAYDYVNSPDGSSIRAGLRWVTVNKRLAEIETRLNKLEKCECEE